MRKLLASSVSLLAIAAAVYLGTGAFFSDTEASLDNTFTVGEIDLKIDSEQHYNNMVCLQLDGDVSTVWYPNTVVTRGAEGWSLTDQDYEPMAWNTANPVAFPKAGVPCTGTWPFTDLTAESFFNFTDIKPGDFGENTISMHVINNDAWACMDVEYSDGYNAADPANQALRDQLMFFAWIDSGVGVEQVGRGNNIYDVGEQAVTPVPVVAGDSLPLSLAIADSNNGGVPLVGDDDPAVAAQYFGVAWCAGTMSVSGNTISCDGEGMTSDAMGGSLMADVEFQVVQARNNPNFTCGPIDGEEPGVGGVVGAALTEYNTPTPDQCDEIVSGGSIQSVINSADTNEGETVCVEDGEFDGNLVVNKSIELLGDGASATSTINGNVTITAPNVTFAGFHVNGKVAANSNNLTIEYNKISPTSGNGIVFGSGSGGAASVVRHNVISSANGLGIYVDQNNVTGFTIENNTVSARKAVGFGKASGGNVTKNVLSSTPDTGADVEIFDPTTSIVTMNNLSGRVLNEEFVSGTLDATNNWWGVETGPSGGQLVGDVDADPYATEAYPVN